MSERPHDDEIDRAFRRAQALLTAEDDGRERRRRQVLAAVAADRPASSRPRPAASRNVWLAAASVAALSWVVVAAMRDGGPEGAPKPAAAPAPVTAPAAEAAAPEVLQKIIPTPERPRGSEPPAATVPAAPPRPRAPTPQAPPPQATAAAVADAPVALSAEPAAGLAAPRAVASDETAFRLRAAPAPSPMSAAMKNALAAGNAQAVASLLDQGEPIESRDAARDTPLLRAVRSGHAELAAMLLRRGARRDATGGDGRSAEALARGSSDGSMRAVFDP